MKRRNYVTWVLSRWQYVMLQVCLIMILLNTGDRVVVYAQEPPRRVNIPHVTGEVNWGETGIFWFGKNELSLPGRNYVDVRAVYSDWSLQFQVTPVDYYLWRIRNATASDNLTDYDAVAVYLDTRHDKALSPQNDDYWFLVGVGGGANNASYERQAVGTGSGWNSSWIPSPEWKGSTGMSFSQTGGSNDNSGGIDFGWTAFLTIPWTAIGFSGPPPEGTVLGLGVLLFDRDDLPPAGYVAPEWWPENFSGNNPASWGELHLGRANYQPSTATPQGVTTIQDTAPVGQTVADKTVEDASMGSMGLDGGDACAGGHNGGSEINHGDATNLFTGSEVKPTHFPCFSKSYLRFSLDAIPPGSEIISATLTLRQFGNAGGSTDDPDPSQEPSWVDLFTISDPWDEMTIHWNNAPPAQENIATTVVERLDPNPGWPGIPHHWDATQAVAQAYAAGLPVNLAAYTSDDERDSNKYFYSSEADVAARPALTVVWGTAQSPTPDFSVNVSPVSQTINSGGAANYAIQLQPSGGFNSAVAITATSSSANVDISISPETILPAQEATLTVTDIHSGGAARPGELVLLSISGTENGVSKTENVTLTIGELLLTYLPIIVKTQ